MRRNSLTYSQDFPFLIHSLRYIRRTQNTTPASNPLPQMFDLGKKYVRYTKCSSNRGWAAPQRRARGASCHVSSPSSYKKPQFISTTSIPFSPLSKYMRTSVAIRLPLIPLLPHDFLHLCYANRVGYLQSSENSQASDGEGAEASSNVGSSAGEDWHRWLAGGWDGVVAWCGWGIGWLDWELSAADGDGDGERSLAGWVGVGWLRGDGWGTVDWNGSGGSWGLGGGWSLGGGGGGWCLWCGRSG
jgi:hypothetical protein